MNYLQQMYLVTVHKIQASQQIAVQPEPGQEITLANTVNVRESMSETASR